MSGMREGSGAKKRATKVSIKDYTVFSTRSKYTCPSCKTSCECGIDDNVTRFRCIYCKRELIINSRKKVEL